MTSDGTTPSIQPKSLAQIAYEAFVHQYETIRIMNGQFPKDPPFVTWYALPDTEKSAWGHTANVIKDTVKKQIKDLITYAS